MHPSRICVFFFAMILLCRHDATAQADTFRIYFPFNSADLHAVQEDALSSILATLKNGKSIGLYGYADAPGPDSINNGLSATRAKNVRTWLLQHGIAAQHIPVCKGMGAVKQPGAMADSNMANRRVDIIAETMPEVVEIPMPVQKPRAIPPPAETKTLKDVKSVKTGETLVLKNINFKPGSHQFLEESMPELEELKKVMTENPKMKIRIEGHICCMIGSGKKDAIDWDSGYENLSYARAEAVFDYLRAQGVSKVRMSMKGFGCSKPKVAPEVTEEDKAQNRRVEIRIVAR